jgi:O-antigen ligase
MFTLAFFFMLALIGESFDHWNLLVKTLAVIAILLTFFVIAVSLARVAYVCFSVGLLYFYWKKGRFKLIGVIVLLALLVSFLPDIIRQRAVENLPDTLDKSTLDRFLSGRLVTLWIPAFRSFIENPLFGRGFNGAGIYILGQGHPISPHSGYVATLCDIGILGLAVAVWLFVGFWKRCSVIYRDTKNNLVRRLALACKAQILILAFSNLTSDHSFLYQPMIIAPFFLTAAILFALYRGEVDQREESQPVVEERGLLRTSPEQLRVHTT